jgi:hypothetical protein
MAEKGHARVQDQLAQRHGDLIGQRTAFLVAHAAGDDAVIENRKTLRL